jgi:peptidoglycan/LPS O-acetylase OafA/YrhL
MARSWFLDLLRATAILAVLCFHCYPADPAGAGDRLHAIARTLWWGVDLFFVLSGYLITGILLATRTAPNRWSSFFARRSLRIFPLYFVWLIAVYATDYFFPRWQMHALRPEWPWFATYAANLKVAWQGHWFPSERLNHLWSLCVEEQFYLLWPFAVFLLRGRQLPALAFALLVASQAGKAWIGWTDRPWLTGYVFPLTRFDAMLAGGLAAWGVRERRDSRTWAWLAALALAVAAAVVGAVASRHGMKLNENTMPWLTSAYAWLFASLIYLTQRSRREVAVPAFARWAIGAVAALSYGLYLSHWIVVGALQDWWPGYAKAWPFDQFAAAAGLSFAVATLLYWTVEKPFLALKNRFRAKV